MNETTPGPGPEHVGVAVAEFNGSITERLLDGAIKMLEELDVPTISVVRVPGALELALVADRLLSSGCDAVVAVGAVIKGETDHYDIVANISARGLAEVALRHSKPVGNAVLTVREYEHALERALPGPANKGAEAARAAVETVRALRGSESAQSEVDLVWRGGLHDRLSSSPTTELQVEAAASHPATRECAVVTRPETPEGLWHGSKIPLAAFSMTTRRLRDR